jgi:hypothetical protein
MRSFRHFATAMVVASASFVFTACATGGASGGASGGAGTAVRSEGAQNSVPSASQKAIANAIDAATAPFVGSLKSKKYYPQSCHTVKLIKAEDKVGFVSMKDAQDAGFSRDLYNTDCQ